MHMRAWEHLIMPQHHWAQAFITAPTLSKTEVYRFLSDLQTPDGALVPLDKLCLSGWNPTSTADRVSYSIYLFLLALTYGSRENLSRRFSWELLISFSGLSACDQDDCSGKLPSRLHRNFGGLIPRKKGGLVSGVTLFSHLKVWDGGGALSESWLDFSRSIARLCQRRSVWHLN